MVGIYIYMHRAPSTPAVVTEDVSAPEPVAFVAEPDSRRLELSEPSVQVDSIQGKKCNFTALLDTGSAASFVKHATYLTFCKNVSSELRPSTRKFVNLKNSPLEVLGSIDTELSLSLLENRLFNVTLFVLKDQAFAHDLILGREFLSSQKLTVTFKFSENSSEEEYNKLGLFAELPLHVADNVLSSRDTQLPHMKIDFDFQTKQHLLQVISEIEKTEIPPVDDDYTVSVRVKDDSIFAYAPRRFAHSERMELRKITDDLLDRGIIKPSVSPYCARVVPIRKRDGRLRLCIDLRPLNNRIIKQKYPFPIIEDCLARLSDKSVFTLLDLKDGFHQIRVEDESTKYFSFATPDGQFEYRFLPFGYSEAPAEFQKRLLFVLRPLIREDRVIVYMDDVLIPSKSVEDNIATIRDVLVLLKKYGFKLNYEKCQFLKRKIEFLGYLLSEHGISLSPRHTEAVKNYKLPTSSIEVQRFLGLASYFRKFIKDFAIKAKPLYNLLKKNVSFSFNDECVRSYETLKKELTSEPVLALYNPAAETELHTDACASGIGAVLLQKQRNGTWAVVAYYSQSTNQAESRYHSFELEMLAIVRATERFHLYLYGLNFTIVTDCNALVYAVNKANLNPRIARWTLALQNYRFKLIHRPCGKMKHVDALSRSVAYVNEMPLERELELRQLSDAKIQDIANNLEYGESEKFVLVNGLVYRKFDDELRFVVPEAMVPALLRAHHDNMGHTGQVKTYEGIARFYWFPSIRKKIADYIDNCFVCMMADDSMNRLEGETSLYPAAKAPMELLHVDHFGPLQETRDRFKHILVMVDAYTRFTWLFAVRSTSTKEVINCLKSIFSIFGNASNIVTDRGTAFTSGEFAKYVDDLRVKHRKVAVASPWANGTVERVNRFIKRVLIKLCSSPDEWGNKLNTLQYVINNTYHAATKASPSRLMLGYEQRSHDDFKFSNLTKQLSEIDSDLDKDRAKARDQAEAATDLVRNYNKCYHDARMRKPSVYSQGDYVLIRDSRNKPGESSKIKTPYKGPYVVSKVLGNNRYVIRDIPGFNLSSKPYNTILSSDKLKYWVKPVHPPPSIGVV